MQTELPAEVDCLIVGGGPGGLTALLYLQRFHRRALLVDAGKSRALRIDRTRNMPGFPEGIAGQELLARLRQQVADVHGTVIEAEVHSLEHDGQGGFIAQVDGRHLAARQVVLATGVVDHEPPLPGLPQLREKGLLRHCPICDGYEHSGEQIVVVGDGPHARAEAEFLAHYSPHVTLLGVQEEAAPDDAHVPAHGEVICLPSRAGSVEPRAEGGLVVQRQDGLRHRFDVLYLAMGVTPRNNLATPLGADVDDKGNVEVDARCRTSVPGLYAVGDVVGGLDQLSVATAQGAIAATAVHNSL